MLRGAGTRLVYIPQWIRSPGHGGTHRGHIQDIALATAFPLSTVVEQCASSDPLDCLIGGIDASTNMTDPPHDVSFSPPQICINLFLPDSSIRRLLEGILFPGADVPEMSHDPKASLAELLPKEDRAFAGCVRFSSTFRVQWEFKSVEEIFSACCSLSEPVDVVFI